MIRTYRVERRCDLEGNTLFFLIPRRDRRKPMKFFDPTDVPPFEGPAADFEIDRKRGGWRFVRRVG